MELQILGSGSCIVNQKRRSSAYFLKIQDKLLMVDTGTRSTEGIRESNHSTEEIDVIINTHRHPDHISDLVPIVQDKVVRSFEKEEPGIGLVGPKGYRQYLENRIRGEMDESTETLSEKFGLELSITELEDKLKLDEIVIEAIESEHGAQDFTCLSIRISSYRGEIVFTGDTDYFEGLADFAREADIIVADCSKPDGEKVKGHMTPTECAKIADKANVNTLVLSHLYPEAEKLNIEETASEVFDGRIIVAEDMMTIQN